MWEKHSGKAFRSDLQLELCLHFSKYTFSKQVFIDKNLKTEHG